MKPESIDEAIKVIENFPIEEDFICSNIRQFMSGSGEPDDNSIELSDYWRECQSIYKEHLFTKHG